MSRRVLGEYGSVVCCVCCCRPTRLRAGNHIARADRPAPTVRTRASRHTRCRSPLHASVRPLPCTPAHGRCIPTIPISKPNNPPPPTPTHTHAHLGQFHQREAAVLEHGRLRAC